MPVAQLKVSPAIVAQLQEGSVVAPLPVGYGHRLWSKYAEMEKADRRVGGPDIFGPKQAVLFISNHQITGGNGSACSA